MSVLDFYRRLLSNLRADSSQIRDRSGLFPAKRSNQLWPSAQASDTPIVNRRRVERVIARKGLSVLIIDDSSTIVAVLGKMLRQNRFQTLGASDAETGMELAREKVPELIFLDIVLPGMSGFEALRQLRRDPVTKGIPIIMISGNVQATEQFYVQRIGADDFMKKPFGREDVFDRIQRLVENGRLPRTAVGPPRSIRSGRTVTAPSR